jgi:hypothetical protein
MIYVLVTVGFKDETIENKDPELINLADDLVKVIKIGFSADEENGNRLKTHSTSNFAFKTFKIINGGTQVDETNIHKYFKQYQYLGRREVFEYRDEIIDFFNKYTTIEEIRKVIPIGCDGRSIAGMRKVGDALEIPVTVAVEILSRRLELSRELITEIRKKIYLLDDYKNGSFKNICDFLEVGEDEFIENVLNFLSIRQKLIDKYKDLYEKIKEATTIHDRLLEICQSDIEEELAYYLLNVEDWAYLSLGKERLKSLGYHVTKIDRELEIKNFNMEEALKERIYKEFHKGDRISKAEIKNKLREIYIEFDYKRSPKGSDLREWFELKPCQLKSNNKRVNGFYILNKKL